MSELKRAQLDPLLARFDPAIRLLLLAGPDTGSVADLAARARAALADPADPLSVVDLAADMLRADPGRLADEAASAGLFGGSVVIRVDSAQDSLLPAVEALLSAPAAGNPVVMTAGDLPRTSALRKRAEADPAVRLLLCYPPDARELARWIAGRGTALGLGFEAGVVDRLIASADGDLGVIGQELEKFALYRAATPDAPQRLALADLAVLGAGSPEEDVAALVQGLTVGDRVLVGTHLRRLPPNEAIAALRATARRLLQLAAARAAMDDGASPADALRTLRPPIFWKEADGVAASLPRWPASRIEAALARVLAAETGIKTPGSPGETPARQAIAAIAAERR